MVVLAKTKKIKIFRIWGLPDAVKSTMISPSKATSAPPRNQNYCINARPKIEPRGFFFFFFHKITTIWEKKKLYTTSWKIFPNLQQFMSCWIMMWNVSFEDIPLI